MGSWSCTDFYSPYKLYRILISCFLGKLYLKYRWHWFSTFFKKMIIYCAVNITWKDKVFSFSGISQTWPLSPSWGQDGCGLGVGVSPRQLLWSTISLNLCNIQERERFLHFITCSCLLNIKMFKITWRNRGYLSNLMKTTIAHIQEVQQTITHINIFLKKAHHNQIAECQH